MNNNNSKCIFSRVEKKYLIKAENYDTFLKCIEPYMNMDQYGQHTICNIYYDTDNYDLIRTSIEKPVYKEKLRLRSYGIPGEKDQVFLEIKKKYKGTVFKRRIALSLKEAENYLEHGIAPVEKNQIFKEIDYFVNFYHPTSKLFLAYDRIAYAGIEDPELRITFDHNIRSRNYDLDLKNGDYGELLLDDSNYLIEIKSLAALPLWLVDILSDLKIYPTSFSKYGSIYKNEQLENRRNESCLQVS